MWPLACSFSQRSTIVHVSEITLVKTTAWANSSNISICLRLLLVRACVQLLPTKHLVLACMFVNRKPAPFDPEIQRALKPRDHSAVLYAPRPVSRRPNEVPYILSTSQSRKSYMPASPMDRGELSTSFIIWLCCDTLAVSLSIGVGHLSELWLVSLADYTFSGLFIIFTGTAKPTYFDCCTPSYVF